MSSSTVHVLFWLDTEDYLTPQTDDAALRIAEIFAARGVRGAFKLVGEKARALEQRGRRDVINALKAQDVGYHSDFHSKHPTIADYMQDADWDEGVAEFIGREGPGVADVERIFGVRPSCYGQGGGNWVPQAYGALRHWDIPAYVSGNSFVALNDAPFVFCGTLAASRLGSNAMGIGFDIDRAEDLADTKATFGTTYERLTGDGGGLISIGMHPCTWVTDHQFWDANFKNGRNPLDSGWLQTPLKSTDRIEAGYRNFEGFVDHVLAHPNARIVPARELPSIYRDEFSGGTIMRNDIVELAKALVEEISFKPLRGGFLSAAEAFSLVATATRQRMHSDQVPEALPVEAVLGPVRATQTDAALHTLSRPAFEEAITDACSYLERHNRVSSEIWAGAHRLSPADFLATASRLLIDLHAGKSPTEVAVIQGDLTCLQYVKHEYAEAAWRWAIFVEGFCAPRAFQLTELQSWTLKPAVRMR